MPGKLDKKHCDAAVSTVQVRHWARAWTSFFYRHRINEKLCFVNKANYTFLSNAIVLVICFSFCENLKFWCFREFALPGLFVLGEER